MLKLQVAQRLKTLCRLRQAVLDLDVDFGQDALPMGGASQ